MKSGKRLREVVSDKRQAAGGNAKEFMEMLYESAIPTLSLRDHIVRTQADDVLSKHRP